MDETVTKIIVASVVSSLIASIVTGFAMTVSFDKRIELLKAEVFALRSMILDKLNAISDKLGSMERSTEKQFDELWRKYEAHDGDIRRIETGGGFQPNGTHGKR
jgi:hypothetical protein